jgi:4-hydroxy-tetrahydrodipicolinate reductase
MRVGVTGATGRMGREVLVAAEERDWSVAPAVSRTSAEVEGLRAHADEEFATLLAEHAPDAVVDFTVPEATVRYAEVCAEAGVPLVSGTTGFTGAELSRVEAASEDVPVLVAANFAKGVAVLRQVVREAVASLPDYDVELTETHHNGKRDAPSGTAKTILDDVDTARDEAHERVHGREGIDPREAGEVGVHVRRAGNVRGEHELLLAGDEEVLTLTHRAESRGVFAAGALDAADWLVGREAGWYDFAEVLE